MSEYNGDGLWREPGSFFTAERRILRYKEKPTLRLPPVPLLMYYLLESYTYRDKSYAFPSITTICRQVRIGRRTVIDAMKFLENIGLITITKQFSERSGRYRSLYTIIEIDEALLEEMPYAVEEELQRQKDIKRTRYKNRKILEKMLEEI